MSRWKAEERARMSPDQLSVLEGTEKTRRQISLGRAAKPPRRHSVGCKGVILTR